MLASGGGDGGEVLQILLLGKQSPNVYRFKNPRRAWQGSLEPVRDV